MKGIIRFVKKLFGIYETGYEYWVRLDDIQIQPSFLRTPPKYEKMKEKWNYYRRNGEYESKIILHRDFTLVNGYTSYCIAKRQGMDVVPVYFGDQKQRRKINE